MRTTITEIAQRAGVSPATVDRVLNARSGVRARTRDIVLSVAQELGYFGPEAAGPNAAIRMDFVLPAGPNSFMRNLRNRLIDEGDLRGEVALRIHDIQDWRGDRILRKLDELRGRTDAVGIIAPDRPDVREALNLLARDGVKIATLVSDIPSVDKVGFVGVDNRAAGRLAGLLMGRLLPPGTRQDIALFVGSRAYRGHEEREMGFRSILAEEFPDLQVSAYAEVGDDRDRAHAEMARILAAGRVAGVYNIGSGNQGIARALREAHLAGPTVFIGHDLTDATRLMLLDRTMDAVIDQNQRVEAREVVRLLASAVRGTRESEYPPRLQVVFRENIPLS